MLGLWPSDAPRSRKWLASIFMLAMLGALAPIIWRSYAPAAHWQHKAWYLSALLMAAGCTALWRLYRSGVYQLGHPWDEYSPLKRRLMGLLCLGFFTGMVWLDVAASLPMAYTWALGQDSERTALVEKKRGGARSCRHQIKIHDVRYWLFEFCISGEDFAQLPQQPFVATVYGRRSALGEHIHAIRQQ